MTEDFANPGQPAEETNDWKKERYGGQYGRLERFPPKMKLDQKLANIIETFSELHIETDEPIRVAEVFAGRAPVSRILSNTGKQNYEFYAFDMNKDMLGDHNYDFLEEYNTDFDATSTDIDPEEVEKYDWVVIENGLYATSISEDDTPPYTKKEAEILRTIALQKAMTMLKPGGYLLISDALNNTSNFGSKRVINFLKNDAEARKSLKINEKKEWGIFWEYLMEHMFKKPGQGASMIDVLNSNKEFIAKSQLFTHQENLELFRKLGLSERVLYSEDNDYLGSNGTYVVMKRSDIENQQSLPTSLGEPITLKYPVHEKLLDILGRFRRKIYKDSKTTDNLPIVDKYDRKPEGITFVYPNNNQIGLAAVVTLQPRGEIGLDAEEIIKPNSGEDFYTYLNNFLYEHSDKVRRKIDAGGEITFAEVRRLAENSLGRTDIKIFFSDLWRRFTSYCQKKNWDIVLFVSDEKRLNFFNYVNKDNGEGEFKKVEGIDIDRNSKELQSMMISASNYFFGDFETLKTTGVLSDQDINNIERLQSEIRNGEYWKDSAERLDNSEEIINSVEKLLTKAPANVNLYYTDHAMLD